MAAPYLRVWHNRAKSLFMERFTGDGVPHVIVEGRYGCPHQSVLSALWRQTGI